jgi:UDP-N-acetylglucosamine acyltransferase
MADIHPTAIVEDGARLGAGVTVGPFSIIGHRVRLADGVSVGSHVVVRGNTEVGERTRIDPHAFIGGDPQDLSYKGEDTGIVIGSDCLIREYATIHRGTTHGRGMTRIGHHTFLMVGAHVAHDCIVGDHVILTNNTLLGGHSEIGDYAILGGAAAVQQRTRIGAHCFVGGLVGVTCDLVPFAMAAGHRAALAGVNVRGLKRRGFDRDAIRALRTCYQLFFSGRGPRGDRIAAFEQRFPGVAAVAELATFLRASGNRPLTLPRQSSAMEDDDDH